MRRKPTDLKTLDQKLLSEYCKLTKYLELHREIDFSSLPVEEDCYYFYEDFCFIFFPSGIVIEDWVLSPRDMDQMLKFARATEKRKRKANVLRT